jgi:hypothetical protein
MTPLHGNTGQGEGRFYGESQQKMRERGMLRYQKKPMRNQTFSFDKTANLFTVSADAQLVIQRLGVLSFF